MVKIKSKWCLICGRKVDLRRKGSYELREDLKPINKQYGYICSSKCKKEYRETMKGCI